MSNRTLQNWGTFKRDGVNHFIALLLINVYIELSCTTECDVVLFLLTGSEVEEKAEAPGEAPDPAAAGLSGARPLGLGVAVLPPLPPDNVPFQPSALAKKRPPTLPTVPPPPPPRLDQEVTCVVPIIQYLTSLTLSACASKLCSPTAIIIMIVDNFSEKVLSPIIQLIFVISLSCYLY